VTGPALPAGGPGKFPVRKANWELANKWLPDKIYKLLCSTEARPEWLPDSDLFWYRYLTSEGRQYWLVDPEKKTKELLFDAQKLASRLTELTGKPHDGLNLILEDLSFVNDNQAIRFLINGGRFEYDPATDKLVQMEEESKAGKEPWQNISPDGALCVYIKGNNLYVVDPEDPESKETQITFEGAKGLSWGTEWDLIEDDDEEKRFIDVTWSTDSKHFAVLRADVREVGDLWLVEHLKEPRPTLKTFKCPLPGEKVPEWELWIFQRDGHKMVRVETDRWKDQRLDDLFHKTLWWPEDSKVLYFVRRSRDFFKVDVCAADPGTGKAMTLIEERLNGQIYIQPPVEVPGEGALWWSMRDGWGHYYFYGLDGRLKNQVTRGAFNVEKVVALDADSGVLFFLANGREEGRNPYYQHLYRINLDGTDLKLLTPEDAEHKVVMSPSNKYFVDSYSRVNLPTRVLLRDNEGKLLFDLETADISRLEDAGWQPPEIFKAKSADRVTDLWGVMYKPYDFDPAKKYPLVTRVYPGRQDEFLPHEFWPIDTAIPLAQLGCIVVRFGNLGGTFKRGLHYREYRREDFRDYGLADKKVVIEQLADRHDFIDIDRVGIMGGSSGGFMTVSALLVHPDFFKVGVAGTSPNDPSQYYNQWVERYHGIEEVIDEDGTKRWELKGAADNLELAGNLEGRLLMLYGAQDSNVHPVHLFRMADAFIKAGKHFDMFVVPGAGHELGGWQYYLDMVMDYFAEHLIGDPRPSVDAFCKPPE
jgi:dipeptidyl aminopeptidase/acylaminoacyl peptidase